MHCVSMMHMGGVGVEVWLKLTKYGHITPPNGSRGHQGASGHESPPSRGGYYSMGIWP